MSTVEFNKPVFNFTKGKISEASQLSFPEGSAKTLLNFDIDIDGSIRRRLGLDLEDAAEKKDSVNSPQDKIITTYLWEDVNSTWGIDIVVVQVDTELFFFDHSFEPLSSGYLGAANTNTLLINSGSAEDRTGYSFSSGKGVLFGAGKNISPFFISIEGFLEFRITPIGITIRDFEGLTDGLDNATRPVDLSPEHQYNLLNQGWGKRIIDWHTNIHSFDIESFKNRLGVYPSNSDTPAFGIASDPNQNGQLQFDADRIDTQYTGTSRAPRGKTIYDPFVDGRGFSLGVSSAFKFLGARPSTISFYAGRVFYGGTQAGGLDDSLFFSQVVEGRSNFGKCYQDLDPSSEEESAVLATDGGVLKILGSGTVLAMKEFGQYLLIFTTRGIWTLNGGADSGFTIESFQVDKVTHIGCVSTNSILETDDGIMYWAETGIFILNLNRFGKIEVSNLTDASIKTDYANIPSSSKVASAGVYDKISRKMGWLYNDLDQSIGFRSAANSLLLYDSRLQAFYDYKFEDNLGPIVVAAVPQKEVFRSIALEQVTSEGVDITSNGVNVTILTSTRKADVSNFIKLVTLTSRTDSPRYDITFSGFIKDTFLDWESEVAGGVDYTSTLETGNEILSQSSRAKQMTYLTMHFNRTEENFVETIDEEGDTSLDLDHQSSCNVQVKWSFSDSATSGRWSKIFQAYKLKRLYIPETTGPFDYGFNVVTSKNKVRGNGTAFSFKIDSEKGKDIQLLGWDLTGKMSKRM